MMISFLMQCTSIALCRSRSRSNNPFKLKPHRLRTDLPTCAPDSLQEPIPLCQPVDRIIAFSHRPHESTKCKGVVLARIASVLVDFGDADLHRSMVLSLDDAVGRAALARHVAV